MSISNVEFCIDRCSHRVIAMIYCKFHSMAMDYPGQGGKGLCWEIAITD